MRYDDIRELINTGDLIAVKRRDSLFAQAIRFFTRSDVTHVGIAVWLQDGLWLAELNGGGNHLVPLSQLSGKRFDVFARPSELPPVRIEAAIMQNLREHVDYGFAALPVIGLLNWFRLQVTGRQRRIVVCSGYCINIYVDAGWPEYTRLLSPGELTDLLEFKFSVSQ